MYNEYEYVPSVYEVYIMHTTHDEVFIDEGEAWEAFEEYIFEEYNPNIDDDPLEDMIDALYGEWIMYHIVLFHDATMYNEWNTEI